MPDIARITNPYEAQPITPDRMREWFQYNPPGRVQQRLVSVDEKDAVTGYAGYVHEADAPASHFVAWVIVDPDHRGEGIGSALWESLGKDLRNMARPACFRMC